jgi:hypothetical protein
VVPVTGGRPHGDPAFLDPSKRRLEFPLTAGGDGRERTVVLLAPAMTPQEWALMLAVLQATYPTFVTLDGPEPGTAEPREDMRSLSGRESMEHDSTLKEGTR